jgi:hypothetical protein
VIAMDGSWSQCRNVWHCAVGFVDVVSGKIVDFEMIEKPIGFSDGTCFYSSNRMEIDGIQCIVNRALEDHDLNAKIMPYVHDRNRETRNLPAKL